MNEREIKLDFYYTEEEFIAGNRLYLFNTPNIFARLLLISALVALLAFTLSLLIGDFPVWAALGIAAALEASLIYGSLVKAPRKYFRGDPRLRDRLEMTFTEEGLHIKSRQIESKLAWSLYTRVIEGRRFYCLVYGNGIRTGTIIPKRAFRSESDEAAFRELLRRHVPKGLTAAGAGTGRLKESEYVPSSSGPPDWR